MLGPLWNRRATTYSPSLAIRSRWNSAQASFSEISFVERVLEHAHRVLDAVGGDAHRPQFFRLLDAACLEQHAGRVDQRHAVASQLVGELEVDLLDGQANIVGVMAAALGGDLGRESCERRAVAEAGVDRDRRGGADLVDGGQSRRQMPASGELEHDRRSVGDHEHEPRRPHHPVHAHVAMPAGVADVDRIGSQQRRHADDRHHVASRRLRWRWSSVGSKAALTSR